MTATPDRPAVSIITGYLGSGKTTLLNHVLRAPEFADAAVIINEFGEIALDHLLVATPGESTVLLSNGCICCEMRGDLVDTLAQLHRKRRDGAVPPFRRVLVETTGLADPVPILQTLVNDGDIAPHFRMDSVIALADAVHGEAQLDAGGEAVKQAALADRILISKPDLVSPPLVTRLRERLAELNPGAEIQVVVRGAVERDSLFGAGVEDATRRAAIDRWLGVARFARDAAGHGNEESDRHAHIDSETAAFCVFHDGPVTRAGLLVWLNLLSSLRGAKLLRVKGLLNVEGEPVVVQAVQTVIHEPVTLERWPDAERRSRLTFITRGMARSDVEKTLPALGYEAGAAGVFDPAAYARFTAVAGNFR